MKHQLFFVIVLCEVMTSIIVAQVPRYLSHQGFLTRADGSPFDTTIAMTFKLYNDSTGGSAVWEETHPSVTVTQGVFNATLGRGTVFTIPFDKQYWLEVIAGAQTLTPRRRLAAAAYSLGPWSTSGNDIYYNYGNVGIGAPEPSEKMELAGLAAGRLVVKVDRSRFGNSSGISAVSVADMTTNTVFNGTNMISDNSLDPSWLMRLDARNGVDQLQVWRAPAGSPNSQSQLLTLTGSGNVGIGTTSPGALLDVEGTTPLILSSQSNNFVTADMLLGAWGAYSNDGSTTSSGGVGGIRVYAGGNYTTGNTESYMTFYTHAFTANDATALGTVTERMRIDHNGYVGIGTTSPSTILSVAQTSATDPIADAWTTYSSRRWKKNIKPLEGALDKVERLQGVSFNWKTDNKHDIGLIAEDVGKVVPEVVAYEENGKDAKSVDYARLVALLIEGMKEQSQQIKELKERMSKMEDGIESNSLGEVRK